MYIINGMIVPLIYHHFSLKEETKRSSNHLNCNLNLALFIYQNLFRKCQDQKKATFKRNKMPQT